MSRSVGLVVPAYHPDPTQLITYVDALRSSLEPDEIRVELDDPEGTYEGLADRLDAEVATTASRRGKGLAITSGFEALDTDIKAFVDADGSTAAESVGDLIDPLQTGDAALAIASRHHPAASVSGRTWMRSHMSAGFATLASLATGFDLSDFQCGAKAITDECWNDINQDLYESGFGWDLEVLWVAIKRGYSVQEVPIVWQEADGSTVPPFRTALGLLRLLGRIIVARLSGADHWRTGATPLLEQPAIRE